YKSWVSDNVGIVVIVDRDDEDCVVLKSKLELSAQKVGLVTASSSSGGCFQVLNRIAIEELEAWFFGDVEAMCTAYPGVPSSLASRVPFRNPDAIKGGTAEALHRVLERAGHHSGGLAKVRAAIDISAVMNIESNRSDSFCQFRDGLRRLVNQKEAN
ncbi:DUF4276 family protein, partial [Nocardia sp. NPDC060220]|uniref:DUF4276 family protein n=1 Tax=Nocardia sp. NPDC060220 TaxID=3347076 RepID=UPI0036470F6F